jgi:hypothetical protein
MRSGELAGGALEALLGRYGLEFHWLPAGTAIPGSYWGETEAGLVGNGLYLCADTPVHSALHEACHWICVDAARRATLHTDANGCDAEEMGVCYLQALLADDLPGYSRSRLFADMDAWGYNFVLGSAAAWFERDSADALAFLQRHGLVDEALRPSGRRRD